MQMQIDITADRPSRKRGAPKVEWRGPTPPRRLQQLRIVPRRASRHVAHGPVPGRCDTNGTCNAGLERTGNAMQVSSRATDQERKKSHRQRINWAQRAIANSEERGEEKKL